MKDSINDFLAVFGALLEYCLCVCVAPAIKLLMSFVFGGSILVSIIGWVLGFVASMFLFMEHNRILELSNKLTETKAELEKEKTWRKEANEDLGITKSLLTEDQLTEYYKRSRK